MVRRLRSGSGRIGLVYGQGGVVSKHHALVLSHEPPPAPLDPDYSVQARADVERGEIPELLERYAGPATIETYTVPCAADGRPLYGVVVARTPAGQRLIARVRIDDERSLALLDAARFRPCAARRSMSS